MGKGLSKFSNLDIKSKEHLVKSENEDSYDYDINYLNSKHLSNRTYQINSDILSGDNKSHILSTHCSKISRETEFEYKYKYKCSAFSDSSSNFPTSSKFPELSEEDKQTENKINSCNTHRANKINSEQCENIKLLKKSNYDLEDFELIISCFNKHFFMRVLDQRAMTQIINEMSLCIVEKDAVLFFQNSIGKYLYIVKEGVLKLYISNKETTTFHKGDSFGELALLHEAPRSGTVVALSQSKLWVLERKNFKKIVQHISKLNYEENRSFLDLNPLLSKISNHEKSILCSSMIKEQYESGRRILREGDFASSIYLIKSGGVNCISKGKVVRTLKEGEFFGERAILLDSLRTMDVVAHSYCVCYSISMENLKSLLGEDYRKILYFNFIKYAFNNSHFLKGFVNNSSNEALENLFELFTIKNFDRNQLVFTKNSEYTKIIVIIEGNLVEKVSGNVIASRGTILFDKEIYENLIKRFDEDIVAYPDCLLAQADLENVQKFIGGTIHDHILKNSVCQILNKISLFKNFSQKKLESLCEKIGVNKYKDKQAIISQGERGSDFYIVKKGKVEIYINNLYVRTLNENENFGERALFLNEPRSATAIAYGEVELFYIKKEDFETLLESKFKDFLLNRLYLQDSSLELIDLEYLSYLGSGNYGQVSLVKSKKTDFKYAVKSISKKQIDYEQMHTNLELEKSILLQVDHPFIVKLVKTLKDSEYIYFLMEYVKGMELFDVIREIGILNKYQCQFYSATMLLAVEYLHQRKFIYRDIKPENIMVLENGYSKLIDFGTSKLIQERTNTIIGTPHYMAPEVVLGEGYSFIVDIWSIAICMYEFMCGAVPFGESFNDPLEVYSAIVNDHIEFPNICKDKEFKSLVNMMLTKNPLNRLFKINRIKNNIWYKDFDWEALINLKLEPPFTPKLAIKNCEEKPYNVYINSLTQWKPEADNKYRYIEKNQKEYDIWFENF